MAHRILRVAGTGPLIERRALGEAGPPEQCLVGQHPVDVVGRVSLRIGGRVVHDAIVGTAAPGSPRVGCVRYRRGVSAASPYPERGAHAPESGTDAIGAAGHRSVGSGRPPNPGKTPARGLKRLRHRWLHSLIHAGWDWI